MSWRQSSGKDRCHECKAVIDLGAAVFAGDLTPVTWCEACAQAVLGKVLGDAQEIPRYVEVPGLTGMRELLAKFAPKVARHWHERDA